MYRIFITIYLSDFYLFYSNTEIGSKTCTMLLHVIVHAQDLECKNVLSDTILTITQLKRYYFIRNKSF